MAIFPAIMGREDEYSLTIDSLVKHPIILPTEDEIISDILTLLLKNYGAVFFGDTRSEEFQRNHYLHLLADNCRRQSHETCGRVIGGVMLPSVGRVYREVAAPYLEISKITCTDPFELARRTRMGEQIAGHMVNLLSTKNYSISCFNCVSDRKGIYGKSCGMHGNYLISRDLFIRIFRTSNSLGMKSRDMSALPEAAQNLITWSVLKVILTGAGKIGSDFNTPYVDYQISERADFIGYLMGHHTEDNRPFLNSRDESHADDTRFARLHMINSEGNRSPWGLIFEHGLMSLFLAAIEDDAMPLDWYFEHPIEALHNISRDLELDQEIEIVIRKGREHKSRKPLELLHDVFIKLEAYVSWAHVPGWCHVVLGEAQKVVKILDGNGPEDEITKMLDWKIKLVYLQILMKKFNLSPSSPASWQHPRIQEGDINYHCLSNEKVWLKIIERLGVRDIEKFIAPYGKPTQDSFWREAAPESTRAYLTWYLASKPHLKDRFYMPDWGRLHIWSGERREHTTIIYLSDPRQFGKKHLESILGKHKDFSSEEERNNLIQLLQENSGPKTEDNATNPQPQKTTYQPDSAERLKNNVLPPPKSITTLDYEGFLREQDERDTALPPKRTYRNRKKPKPDPSTREPEDWYDRSMGHEYLDKNDFE